ncbi:transport permease protein [Methylomagnum ishizawai]|nr:transport permease protein [Methylomagnum ishizawai]
MSNYWLDLWRYRELFYFMAWRDILLRYKRMSIGFAWAVIRPVLTMLIFTLVFSRIAKLPSGGMPYPLLVYTAMLPWQFFATAFADAGNSLTNKESIIAKVYFPRLIVPASAVIVSFADFVVALVILAGLMVWYGIVPDLRFCALPAFALLVVLVALGAGLWISALSVKYKDFRYIIPFAVQLGLYISPVGFNSTVVPEAWRWAFALNPMVGVIDGFRWSVLGMEPPDLGYSLGVSLALALFLLVSGTAYFRRLERSIAELL